MPNYVGKGWGKEWEGGGLTVSISVNMEAVGKLPVDKYGNVRLVVGKRRTRDEKSKADFYVAEDEFQTKKLRGDDEQAVGDMLPDDSPF